MEKNFSALADSRSLDELIATSHQRPVVLFKHSTTCPISSAAYQEMSRLDEPISLVIVQRSRDVSREIEARTGVKHESPQTIILRHGQAVWSASHFDITSEVVAGKVREYEDR